MISIAATKLPPKRTLGWLQPMDDVEVASVRRRHARHALGGHGGGETHTEGRHVGDGQRDAHRHRVTAVGLEQVDGGLLADAFHAGNVVRRIAHQSHDLDDPRWLDPEPLAAFRLAGPFILHGIVNPHVRRQELEHVLVARDDHDVVALALRLLGARSPGQQSRPGLHS